MTMWNRPRNRGEPSYRCMWDRVCPLGHPDHTARVAGLVALTNGQRLVFAIVLLVFVVCFVVLPVVRPHQGKKDIDREASQRRLMRELGHHHD